MDEIERRLEDIRKDRNEAENHLIDEYTAGKISRRDFVRRGTIVGMSISLLSFLAAVCGGETTGGDAVETSTSGMPQAGDERPDPGSSGLRPPSSL